MIPREGWSLRDYQVPLWNALVNQGKNVFHLLCRASMCYDDSSSDGARKMAEDLSPSVIQDLIEYDPDTGLLYWKPRPEAMFPNKRIWRSWNTRYAGKVTAQSPNEWGYLDVSILGVKHASHRVAWAIAKGEWPEGQIDHKNRNASDNRLSNLRIASATVNARNKGDYKNNKSGYRGVTWHKSSGKWMAQIKMHKRNIHLGLFSDPEEAGKAYEIAAERLYGAR